VRPPLSKRGRSADVAEWEGPYDGVPDWLWPTVRDWISTVFVYGSRAGGTPAWDYDALHALERHFRVLLDWSEFMSPEKSLIAMCAADETFCLDLIDWCLENVQRARDNVRDLMVGLDGAGSVWTVGLDPEGKPQLERRIDATVAQAVETAAPSGTRAAAHLSKAWSEIYGRSPDPSSGYREAVRAVEAIAQPVVSPANATATLGTMIRDMQQKPEKWSMVLNPTGDVDAVQQLIGMMQLLWKSQLDRHGTADEAAPLAVTQEEAEAGLHIAAALVHLFGSGAASMVR
jgi:hypothetical protein